MNPTYVPVFKAMKSELEAVARADKSMSRKMHPLFDITRIGQNVASRKWFQDSAAPTMEYLDRVIASIANAWGGRVAIIDAYHWPAGAEVESGEHVLPYIYGQLEAAGVLVVPVVGYDRWDNQSYRLAMKGLELNDAPYFCLRLDVHAIEDAAEPEFFKQAIDSILNGLDLDPAKCSVLIDFGDVTSSSVEEMVSGTEAILAVLGTYGFKYFSTAGCSLPKSIDLAVKKPDSIGKVTRKEMLLWQTMRQERPGAPLVYGDYGVRGPASNEGIRNPHGNAKIRYTIDKGFFVVRGHSMMWEGKGEQVWGLSQTVVDSKHFMGSGFSWGDQQIEQCCKEKKFKGTHGQWITIDTSHHMAYVVAEVEEFELSVMSPVAVISENDDS